MARALFAAAALALLPLAAHAQSSQQALVDRATLAVQEMTRVNNGGDLGNLLHRARAVMICPRVFRAGFILGGSGGGCVLLARGGAGSWSDPAFYNMGSGSIGFQAGIQDAELIMCVLTDKGLAALLDDQFKIGADASIALLTVGAGVEGAITANVGADIVAFSETRGLFGGISLGGSLMTSDTGWNQAYYGRPLAARQIVIDMQANNPGADPLRAALMRFTPNQPPPPPGVPYAQAAQPAYAPPPAYAAGPAAAPATAVAPTAPVQSQPLPPPTR